MSSESQSMVMNQNLFEEQDMAASQLGLFCNFHTNFTSLPILAADDHLPDLISNLSDINYSMISTKQKDEEASSGFFTPAHLAGSQILSLAKSTTNNYWAWGELGDHCMNMRKSTGGDNIDQHLRVSAMKMKKIYKPRRKMREPRFSFKTMSDVDVLDDGYKWRKYGQKIVKDTLHPRSYYKCTQENCHVKKRVERLEEDPRMVITTYEGRHIHSPSHHHYDQDQDQHHNQASSQLNNFFW